jgi:hypothetical protein
MTNTTKKKLTEAEKALIPSFCQKHIDMQTIQPSMEEITKAVNDIWEDMGYAHPNIILKESPIDCLNSCPDRSKMREFWSIWFGSYSAMYDFASHIGIELDKKKLEMFLNWTHCCPFVLASEDTVYVSKKLTILSYNDSFQLHNESGPACAFPDGYSIWLLNNVSVTEQIVMRPETQTIEEIRNEPNEEVKRIRIERYGMEKYLAEIEAKLLDRRTNHIEGTRELLYKADDMVFILCICPSTGKDFCLEVDPGIRTCEDAQRYLSGGLCDRIIYAT